MTVVTIVLLCTSCVCLGRRDSAPLSLVQTRNSESSITADVMGGASMPLSPPGSTSRLSTSTVMVLPELASLSDSEEVEEIEFNNQIGGEGCLPNSSYYEEDTLFTWADITGEVCTVLRERE